MGDQVALHLGTIHELFEQCAVATQLSDDASQRTPFQLVAPLRDADATEFLLAVSEPAGEFPA